MDAKPDLDKWKKAFGDVDFDEYTPEVGPQGFVTNESYLRAAEEYFTDNNYPKYEAAQAIQEGIMSMGHDGVTHIGGGRVKSQTDAARHRVYIAFEPAQIKSVFNKGTWNPNDPRISYGVGAGGAGAASQQEDK